MKFSLRVNPLASSLQIRKRTHAQDLEPSWSNMKISHKFSPSKKPLNKIVSSHIFDSSDQEETWTKHSLQQIMSSKVLPEWGVKNISIWKLMQVWLFQNL